MKTSSGLASWPKNKAVYRKKYGICSVTGGTEIAKTIMRFLRNQSLYSISDTHEDKILLSLIHIFANVFSSPSQCWEKLSIQQSPQLKLTLRQTFFYTYLIALLSPTYR